jgi:hypothetical protein
MIESARTIGVASSDDVHLVPVAALDIAIDDHHLERSTGLAVRQDLRHQPALQNNHDHHVTLPFRSAPTRCLEPGARFVYGSAAQISPSFVLNSSRVGGM